jgi:hypothetical protein
MTSRDPGTLGFAKMLREEGMPARNMAIAIHMAILLRYRDISRVSTDMIRIVNI